MDKRIIAIMALAVAVSGCTDLIQTESSPEGIEPDPGKGLEITSLSVADETLRAGEDAQGQRTEITMTLSNHHDKEIDPEIGISNTGQLIMEDTDPSEAQCNKEVLDPVTEETVDQMQCTWGVYAPSQSSLGAFDEKPESATITVKYDSQITNHEPLQFQFLPQQEIADSNPVERKFSNNEVQMTIRTDNPSAMAPENNTFQLALSPAGSGDVISEGYDPINYQPSSIFHECPDHGEGRIESEFTATCSFSVSSQAQRNVFVSAEYKYQKQQTLPITIVR